MKVKSLSRVRLLATPWTAAYQTSPSMGFSGQEYWSGVPLPSPSIYLPIYNPVNLSDFFFVKCTWSESNEVIIKFWFAFAWYSYFCHFTSNSISLCFICILQAAGAWILILSIQTVYNLTGELSTYMLTDYSYVCILFY